MSSVEVVSGRDDRLSGGSVSGDDDVLDGSGTDSGGSTQGGLRLVDDANEGPRSEERPGPPAGGETTVPDLDAASAAAAQFLAALGVDCDTPSTVDSPRRMAHAYAEMLTPREFEMTTFPNDESYSGLVLVTDIPVRSVCEHHLLPFTGVAHVGYLPRERILGLSKFARVVEMFAKRPQVQERLTQQVARWIQEQVHPAGVAVVIEAEHSCMRLRGAMVDGALTRTTALTGQLDSDRAQRAEFLSAIPRRRS